MKINTKILSIPPYISTTWDCVSGIFFDEATGIFHVTLHMGTRISIPNLDQNAIKAAFKAHADYIESYDQAPAKEETLLKGAFPLASIGKSPINFENLGAFTGMMQHDPSQSNASDLPKEILERVSQVAKALGLDQESFDAPEGQPHCNCPYCQIAKALHGNFGACEKEPAPIEEEITDTELKFREWDVRQVAEKLYEVSNPFDKSEHYQVYLGQPIGCTCGKNNCQHIIAVLNS